MLLPIAPSKIETIINNRSQTVDLINGQEVNILKNAGLTQIQFEFTIPSQKYPFATFSGGFVGATAILGYLEYLKTGSNTATALADKLLDTKLSNKPKPFQFIVARIGEGLKVTNAYNTNMKVTLEDYTIIEDASNGQDIVVSVRLLQYKSFGTKTYNSDGTVTKKRA